MIMAIWACYSEEPLWLSLAGLGPCMSPSHLETGLLGLRAECSWWALLVNFQIGLTTSSISM